MIARSVRSVRGILATPHLGLAVATLAFTALHLLLDGVHFAAVQEALGCRDPLAPHPA